MVQCRKILTHHFICHYKQVVLLCEGRNLLELLSCEDLAYGIVRGIDHDHFGTRGYRAPDTYDLATAAGCSWAALTQALQNR